MKTVKNIGYKGKKLHTSFGTLVVDDNGIVIDPILTQKQINILLTIPGFELVITEDKKEEVKEIIVEVKEESKGEAIEKVEDDKVDLTKLTVKELKALAKEKGIELESTKKADIIKELEANL